MIIYPAIDLKGGECVRLKHGEMDSAVVFNSNPATQAASFAQQGAEWLHVVDLDGAFEGKSMNSNAIEGIRAAIDIPIQLGGGIRDLAGIEAWLDHGIDRVILGTIAVRNPDLVKQAAKKFPNRIAVGIDSMNSMVAVSGWGEMTQINDKELAARMADVGVSAIIYTDISRDGAFKGVNIDATAELAEVAKIPVIASGGVTDINDIHALAKKPEISGVIIGRALYENRLALSDAVAISLGLKMSNLGPKK